MTQMKKLLGSIVPNNYLGYPALINFPAVVSSVLPLPASVTLRLTVQGSSFNLFHQFSHYTIRECSVLSSSPSGVGNFLGFKVSHVRMRVGTVNNQAGSVVLGIYEGVGNACVLKARSITFDMTDLTSGQIYDVPLLTPYKIGTDQADEVGIATAVTGGASVQLRGDSLNSNRRRITYNNVCSGMPNPPQFPANFLCNESSLANEAPEQRLIHEDTIAGGILLERTPV